MKKILLIIVAILGGEYALSQDTCKVPILEIADTSLHGVIDTLLSLEQSIGTQLDNNDKIVVYFFEPTGHYCQIQYIRDSLEGEEFTLLDNDSVRVGVAHYKGREVIICGFLPDKITTATGRYKSVSCVWPSDSDQELLSEDYEDETKEPNFSIMAKLYNYNNILIYIIADKMGNTIYSLPQ